MSIVLLNTLCVVYWKSCSHFRKRLSHFQLVSLSKQSKPAFIKNIRGTSKKFIDGAQLPFSEGKRDGPE